MSSETLYRKYRSKAFKDVIGQEHITKTLVNSIKNKTFAHAYLLTGPRGVGKTSIARLFAYEVNGLKYGEGSMYSDIIEIDAASNRRIDEIRELREKVNITPSALKYKVYIIDEVHMLTKEAFNALLKTLEEPPEHAIFILATTDFHKVPDTITSRCIRFAFNSIPVEKIKSHLKNISEKESIDVEDEALGIIADNSEGSFRDAISLLDQFRGSGEKIKTDYVIKVLGMSSEKEISSLINSVGRSEPKQIVDKLESLKSKGANEQQIIKQLIAYLRECLIKETGIGLEKTEIIGLIQDLLKVHEYFDVGLAMEIILIEACKNVKPMKEADTKKTNSPQDNLNPAADTVGPDKQTNLNADTWKAALENLKSENNTLYAVARMAEARSDGNVLELYFKFPFHYKKVSLEKNYSQIENAIKSIDGSISKVSIFLQENTDGSENIKSEVRTKEPINRISNIFGPSEVLES